MQVSAVFRANWMLCLWYFLLQDTFDIRILMAKSVKYTVNFLEAKEEDLYRCVHILMADVYWCLLIDEHAHSGCRIEIPFKFHMMHSGLVHGLAFWFDVAFMGSV